jgi:hypothetical protein
MTTFSEFILHCRAYDNPRGDFIRDARGLIEDRKFPECNGWRDLAMFFRERGDDVDIGRRVWAEYRTWKKRGGLTP